MKQKFVRFLAVSLGAAAVIFVTTACLVAGHRPEVPAELLNK